MITIKDNDEIKKLLGREDVCFELHEDGEIWCKDKHTGQMLHLFYINNFNFLFEIDIETGAHFYIENSAEVIDLMLEKAKHNGITVRGKSPYFYCALGD